MVTEGKSQVVGGVEMVLVCSVATALMELVSSQLISQVSVLVTKLAKARGVLTMQNDFDLEVHEC